MLRVTALPVTLALLTTLPVGAQQFGGALALGPDALVVSEARNQTLSGIVYVYEERDGTWAPSAELRLTDELRAPDGFGQALSLDGDLLVVGAPLLDEAAGGAVVFERNAAGVWAELARLKAAMTPGPARLGSAVAAQGDLAMVGAPAADDGAGAVLGFERREDGSWTQTLRLTPGASGVQGFGTKLALDGDLLLVASAGERGEAATVFSYALGSNGRWVSAGTLDGDELGERSRYGSAIALKNGVAVVGAPGAAQGVGRVFVFERWMGEKWVALPAMGPMVAHSNAQFGASVGFDGERAAVGAPGTTGNGALYLITRDAGAAWRTSTVVTSDVAGPGARLGVGGSVAALGGVAVTGALGVDEGQGAALVMREGSDGTWTQTQRLINDPRGFDPIMGEEVYCVEGQAALFECQDVNITAFLPISDLGGSRGTRVNDVWGWTDSETGIEYVIVGRTNGTSFVDISDPFHPVYIGDLPKTEGTRTTIWRDMKVYKDHVYIVADAAGEHGVQVFDLTQLRDFDGTPTTYEETFLYDGIHSAHNIVINEETGFGYAVGNSGGGETCGGGLHMIDLRTPAQPTFAGCFSERDTGRRGTGYSHDAQCVVYRGPDQDYQGREVCFGSNETALNIADVTDKSAPVSIATASYPSVAYAHQGWLTEDHTFFYMNDEGDEPQGLVEGTRTLVWDVRDLDDPLLVKEHISETTATDHNLYVKGDRMYQSNYSAGFRVLDVSNPADPVEIGFFDTSPYEGGASWSNYPFFKSGIIAVTGTGDGLFLVKDMARRNLVP